MTEARPLAGYVVAVTAERRRAELGGALERRGAQVLYGPAIRVVPLVDDTELHEATRRALSGPLDFVVATTGVGFAGWLAAAGDWGSGEALLAALGAATILTRGPKARGAVRAAGLREAWSPEQESSSEVLRHLLAVPDLPGRRVAVQLHGDPLTEFVTVLRAAGAEVVELPVYRWTAPLDEAPLHAVIERTAAATLDCVTFTSAPAATHFLRTTDELGVRADVLAALRGRVLCAAVGSVTAAPFVAVDVPVLVPERFRLGALVREVTEQLPARGRRSAAEPGDHGRPV